MRFTDLLFKRYSDPMVLVTQMIRTHRFYEFIDTLVQIRNEEIEEDSLWYFWLHKDFEHSYIDFKEQIKNSIANQKMTEAEKIAIVKHSFDMVSNFNPEDDTGYDIADL